MKGVYFTTLLGLSGLLGLVMGAAAFLVFPGGKSPAQAPPLLAFAATQSPEAESAQPPAVFAAPRPPEAEPAPEPSSRPPPISAAEIVRPHSQQTARPAAAPAMAAERRSGAPRGLLAIVIDDLGHNLSAPRRFLKLSLPLTFSVLPELQYSRAAAEMVMRGGREYLVHLPMQPMKYPEVDPGPSPLLLRLDEQATLHRTEAYFEGLPQAIGASTHMGSAYTFDAAHMEAVQRVVARRGLLFLDSKTSASRIPRRIARARGYSYLERNVFLDNVRNERAVVRQLRRAVRVARRRGQAVAVGHPYGVTLRVLRDHLTAALGGDVALVPLSKLARR